MPSPPVFTDQGHGPGPSLAARERLAVYVTSHGFGHLNRTAAVLNRIPPDVPVTIRSHPNLFDHWRERLTRPVELERVRLGRRAR